MSVTSEYCYDVGFFICQMFKFYFYEHDSGEAWGLRESLMETCVARMTVKVFTTWKNWSELKAENPNTNHVSI